MISIKDNQNIHEFELYCSSSGHLYTYKENNDKEFEQIL